MADGVAIYCRDCDYDLASLEAGACPECGRAFDPATPRSFARRPRGGTLRWFLIGLGAATLLLVTTVLAWSLAYRFDYGTDRFLALFVLLGIGLTASLLAAVLAAWNRSWWGRLPILGVGILGTWIGLLVSSDLYFRVWQAMPNPPDEAYADSGPAGALLFGWMPGILVMVVLFVPAWSVAVLLGRRPRPSKDRPEAPRTAGDHEG